MIHVFLSKVLGRLRKPCEYAGRRRDLVGLMDSSKLDGVFETVKFDTVILIEF